MTISPNARTVFRNYVMDGVPSSGIHKINKGDERNWGTALENAIDAYSSGAGSIAKATRALLYADLAHAADVMAWVYADSTVGYNGIYRKSLGTGTGSWTRILDLPYDVITATDTGAGTPNAIVATSSIPVSESALILLNMFEANTASPVTVAFNGGSALTIKTASGNDVASGGLVAGAAVLGRISGSTFRMVSDQSGAAIQAAAEAAQAAAEAAAASVSLPTTLTPLTIPVTNAAGTAREDKTDSEVRDFLDLAFVDNYSMPVSPNPAVIYIKSTGTDTITGPSHGTTEGTAFLTFDAAINHAKKYYRFIGKLNTVTFKFEGGIDWGYIALGSNLDQGEDSFPFAIKITSISDASRAEFTGISLGTWHPNYLYATKIKAGYFAVTRRNAMVVNDVSLISTVTVPYAFRAAFGGKMNIFGDIDFEDVVTYSVALIYNQDMGNVGLENGDTPLIFPECNFINLANVTSPYIYRMVLGSGIYCPANPYADLQALSGGAYYVDSTSYSTQTQSGTDLDENSAVGGPVVTRSGTNTSGWEKYADGKFKQWGILAVTSAASGVSAPASALLTFPVAFSANPRIRYNWGLSTVVVSNPGPSTTGLQFVVNNLDASAASFNIFWEASGDV